jgi:hypothetical protein
MKAVYNTKGFGLHLNEAEMRMFAALRGWSIRDARNYEQRKEKMSSANCWFNNVDWEEFRTDPLLVRLCEEGMLSNERLAVCEFDECSPLYEEGWTIKTDYCTYEQVYSCKLEDLEMEQFFAQKETTTEGETA